MKWMKLVIIALLLPLVACSHAGAIKEKSSLAYADTQKAPPLPEDYRIQAGDQLDVKFYFNKDLNEQVTVRPDGRISLQLIQAIMAAELTPEELTAKLTKAYSKELKNPEITVIVRSFSSQRIYVDGEVNRAGMINLVGPMTVLQSISQAGGLKETARSSEVIVIRRGKDNKPVTLVVDLDNVIYGTDSTQDISLMPYDIVHVPRSTIANVNVWVDQYIRKNIPISVGVQYNLGTIRAQ